MSLLADTINKYLKPSGRDAEFINKELTRLEGSSRSILRNTDRGGRVVNLSAGNVDISISAGVTILNPSTGKRTIRLHPTGDLFAGLNIDVPADTSFLVFSNDQTYNSEVVGKGDVMMGDNSASKANLFWDRSTGRLNLRAGTTSNIYLDTDGTIIVGEGIVLDGLNETIYVGSAAPRIVIDGANKLIKSSNFSAGVDGFQVSGVDGSAEFQNIIARGEIHSSVFVKDLIDARAGSLFVSKSAGVLSSDMSVPASSTWTMTLSDPPGGGFLFADNDYARIKANTDSGVVETYFTVASRTDNGDGTQSYTCTYGSGTRPAEYTAGTGVIDYGVSGDGFLFMTADDGDAPFYSVRTWATNPWTGGNITERARLGNMRNAYGTSTNNRYGFGVGDYSGGNYLSYNAETADGFIIKGGAGTVTIDANGVSITRGDAGQNKIQWTNAGTPEAEISESSSGHLTLSTKTSGGNLNFFQNSVSRMSIQSGVTTYHDASGGSATGDSAIHSFKGIVRSLDNIIAKDDVYTVAWTDYSGSSTIVGWSSLTNTQLFYKKIGKLVFVWWLLDGTSNSTSASFTVPFTAVSVTGTMHFNSNNRAWDNGSAVTTPGMSIVVDNTSTVLLFKDYSGSNNWTAANRKICSGSLVYEVA